MTRNIPWLLALALAAAPLFAAADQLTGTHCTREYGVCKQTAKADNQACKNAKEKDCSGRLKAALRSCSATQQTCR
jgi:hypothetical protein